MSRGGHPIFPLSTPMSKIRISNDINLRAKGATGIKVLFTSGHTKDVILDKRFKEEGFHFITTPMTLDDVLRNVREVLD